jgi:hypothetical protein
MKAAPGSIGYSAVYETITEIFLQNQERIKKLVEKK